MWKLLSFLPWKATRVFSNKKVVMIPPMGAALSLNWISKYLPLKIEK